jgi:alpha-amylase
VSSVAISGDGVSNGALSLEKGKSVQLSAAVSPSNATNKTVSWSSSDASVVSVTGTGYVSAVKAGTATVTATAGGKSTSVKVTVTEPSSQRFSDVPLSAWYASSVSWAASSGVVSGYGDGRFGPVDVASRAQAVAMLQKLDKLTGSSSSLSISGDGVSNGKLSLDKGATVQLSAVNVPSDASTVTWWSDDDVVAVTGTGLVVGVKAGSGVVHVQAGSVRCADGHGEVARFPGVVAAGSRYRRGRPQHHMRGIPSGICLETFVDQKLAGYFLKWRLGMAVPLCGQLTGFVLTIRST